MDKENKNGNIVDNKEVDQVAEQKICTETRQAFTELSIVPSNGLKSQSTKEATKLLSAVPEDLSSNSDDKDDCKPVQISTGTQVEGYNQLLPFNFAKELQLFSEKHILALRQAKEKDEKTGKEYGGVREMRTLIDKTKRNLVETCKLREHTISVQKDVVSYDKSVLEK